MGVHLGVGLRSADRIVGSLKVVYPLKRLSITVSFLNVLLSNFVEGNQKV